MKAWITKENNGFPSFVDIEVESDLTPVELHSSALNHRDVWIAKGLYPGIKPNIIMGSDGAGTYHGKDVVIFPSIDWGNYKTHQGIDFRVLGVPDHGTFAEKIYIEPTYIFDKPAHLTFQQAAALPLAGLTAYRALFTKSTVVSTEKVLISGIGGGVALFAMQFAISLGCEVYVSSSSDDKISKAIEMGAKGGFNYNDDQWPTQLIQKIGGVDVVIDGACGQGFNNLIKVCNPGGRIAFYGATKGNISDINARTIFWKQLSILGSTMGSIQDFEMMLSFVTTNKIVPIVDSVYSFEDIHKALQRMDEGHQFGKIVVEH
jgi:zinc-binding alcohol dehydrogenase/oxidoreductase